jgi:ribosomal protein S6--L-glutamate ligase
MSNRKVGVIGIRGAWSTEALSAQLKKKNAGGEVLELNEIGYDLAHGRFEHREYDLESFDALIIKKMGKQYSSNLLDQLELLELLERRGMRFFSSPAKIRQMISRLACTVRLWENDIPMPPTFITEDESAAAKWVEENGPAVMKPLYSTKARGMVVVSNEAETSNAVAGLRESGEKIIYLQKKLELSGADYGLVFLGGEFIGAYSRVGDGSTWHTTTQQGGKYAAFTPPQDMIDLACKAQDPFGLDFTCVDVAVSAEQGPVVFEVSAFGAYRGLFESAGVDASDMLTDFAIKKLN